MLSPVLQAETVSGTAFSFAFGITDLSISGNAQGSFLISVSREGIARFGIGIDGTLSLLEEASHAGMPVAGYSPRLLDAGGALYLSGFVPVVAGRWLQPDGALGAETSLEGPAGPAFDMVRAEFPGEPPVVVQATATGGVDVFRDSALGVLEPVSLGAEAELLGGVRRLALHDAASGPVLLTVNPESAALTALSLGKTGSLEAVGRIDAASGVGLAAPGALAVAEVAGQGFAVLASAGSGALSVAGIGADGSLWLADHVIDTRDTRFAGTTAVETLMVGSFAFVAAGGADDGISLLTILPDGRLVHLASVADSVTTALENVSVLALKEAGGAIQIIAAGEGAPGLTRLTYDVTGLGDVMLAGDGGAGDDIVAGGAGDDVLGGGAGRDLIADGAGSDRLTGGPGADLFILSGDATPDRIMDFAPGEDRLDLSDWRFFYAADQLSVLSVADGAVITYRDERLEIRTASGSPMSHEEVAKALWMGPDRPPLVPVGQSQQGGAGADTLLGGIGADSLFGGTGEDRLVGGPGDDMLFGEAGFDVLLGGAGNDHLAGGAQADVIRGGAGADTLLGEDGLDTLDGEAGADRLEGGSGNDRLRGGDGDDVLIGGTQEDRLWGEAGADRLEGGAGFDRLEGGEGDDWLDGGAQADNLFGGPGDDMLLGQDGFDRLFGGPGDDVLDGGAIGDGMFGEQGDDALYGGPGDDRLNGGPGNDLVDGGTGADTLRGGAGFDTILAGAGDDLLQGDFNADTFVFADGFGADVIADFDALNGFERIDLSAVSEIADWADLMSDHVAQLGVDVRITAGADSIMLSGVSLADLDPGDFVF